eukprot:SAG25_NODE_7537_length_474_cov_0.826667_2_plen_63_part_01
MHHKDFCGFAGLRHTACVCCVARREGNYPFPSTYITYSPLPVALPQSTRTWTHARACFHQLIR